MPLRVLLYYKLFKDVFLIQQRKNIKQFMLTTGSIWLVEIQINQHFGPRLSTYRHALTHTNRRLELVIDSSLI